jgi:hypothetical protein
MLTNLIENRGKEFSNLVKIGDYLARSLRENVELFYVENGKVTYLTESGGVINANYSFKPNLKLTNIEIEDSSILENREAFDLMTNKKVSNLLSNLLESDYHTAENQFEEILNLFETKLSYERIKERLNDKISRFGADTKIVSTPQFQKVSEVKDKIVEFLKENKEILDIPEIKNGLKLSTVVSKAFNLPKITLEQLAENKTFSLKGSTDSTIYDHLCKQELIAKELLEAKENFDTTWANNELISELASMVYDKRSKVEEKVAEIVTNIPYFALATKKQISNIIENSLSLSDVKISNKDITNFVSNIFEMKKPVKDYIINLLNEKYGINVNNLTDVPTFNNLLKTEMVVLASLAKLAPKNSVIKQTLFELANSLKDKNGAESIDVADFLNEIFSSAGYKKQLNETNLLQYLDFAQVADDLGKIGSILKMLKPALGGGESMGGEAPQMQVPSILPEPMGEEGMGEEDLGEEGMMEEPEMGAAEEAAGEVQDEEAMGAEGEGEMAPQEEGMGEMPMEGEPEETSTEATSDEINDLVSRIEDLLGSIKGEMGTEGDIDGDGEVEGGAEGDPEFTGEEEGDEDMDGEVEGEKEGEEEGEEELEEEDEEEEEEEG